ncbi:MAG: DNA polymerase IV [Campylobacteraceae bacterium 4484_166]|nr:MAG: DNA polymerase IV [Campylobacteraceae bacterium 4484_166]
MILHIDIDCFFASAHRIDTKIYDDMPIAVGGRSNLNIFDKNKQKIELSKIDGAFSSSILSSNDKNFKEYFVDKNKKIRGIITTSSYEARAYGVKTAMSVSEALRFCPDLIVLPPNYPLYHKLSYELKEFLKTQIPTIEQFSIDEFFGDVRGYINEQDIVSFATKLQKDIKKIIKIPVSIGICEAKWIAKLATNTAKPYGIKYVKKEDIEKYISNIKVEKFPGIGKGYQKKLAKLNIKYLIDIKKHKKEFFSWGKYGVALYNRVLGLDDEKISIEQTDKKSIGIGRTFDAILDTDELKRRLLVLCRHISFLCFKQNLKPHSYHLSIRYEYGQKKKNYINIDEKFSERLFKSEIIKLFSSIHTNTNQAIIQLNITATNFKDENKNKTLFDINSKDNKNMIDKTTNSIREKYGIDIIKTANEL